jgi:SAM-dependent MidA family methyltransferase
VNRLREKIEQEIRDRGPIRFSRYMELCLYDSELGYYAKNAEQFGKAGDFYTSSDVHAVFGRLMARQFEEIWGLLSSPDHIDVVELGPGRGLFAQDVLGWAERKFPDFFAALRCVLIESSPALRKRIESTLHRYLESGKAMLSELHGHQELGNGSGQGLSVAQRRGPHQARFRLDGVEGFSAANVSALSSATFAPEVPTIIFANEFFDALPVEILSTEGSLRIDARHGRFIETWAPASNQELEFLDCYSAHPEPGERFEVPLVAQKYMARIAATVQHGFLIIIDYGYTREEQLAGRHRGTLKAIRKHSISANPYEAPGEQDITADVNFTAIAAAAEKQGMNTQKLITQSQFLMGIGEANQFADAFEECRLPQERAKVALQLKHLVTPAGMGEGFHVLIAAKGVEPGRLTGLSGLSFG